jgi:Uncharacterized conserved protein (DUF2075)
MASFYRSTVGGFLSLSDDSLLARLSIAYANRGYTSQYSDQTLTWERDLRFLRLSLEQCARRSPSALNWGVLLEFSIPRKEVRIDVVLLIGNTVVIVEAKSGHAFIQARRQIEEYALLLHYFHKASSEKRIIPIIVSPEAGAPDLDAIQQYEMFPQLAIYWIAAVIQTPWVSLSDILGEIAKEAQGKVDPESWDDSPYHPVPSIIEAAMALRTGLDIREIAHSEASEHEIEMVRDTIQDFVDQARYNHQHAICFLTGVPGSGKTLVGLSLAHADQNKADAVHFMSGNGPLVKVLQHLFTQESRKSGTQVAQARIEAKTLIENVHVFARYHTEDNVHCPSNHAIIFDEAQRAWNRAQNKKKFARDYSEPEMLLSIMERHEDWAAVIALVGGGQEINDGEAGLEEWGKALSATTKDWVIYASPEVLDGGPSTAGHRLFDANTPTRRVYTSPALHLRTSNRSLRAEKLATWVNHVIDGNNVDAAALGISAKFPIFLSRNLDEVRLHLRQQGIGKNRYGLVGSSGAARLRAEGLEPNSTFHSDYPWEHWYLAEQTDVRSSFQCEVFATEFEIQGLELDWIGVCWGGDFIWSNCGWQLRNFRPASDNRWLRIKNADKRTFRKNAYRVLLTRARQGMILFVPKGNDEDPTISTVEFNSTADYLVKCGVTPLPSVSDSRVIPEDSNSNPLLLNL